MGNLIRKIKGLNYKFILYILLILFTLILVTDLINSHYKFLIGNNLLNKTQVIYEGDFKVDKAPESKINSNNYFGPFRNLEVKIDDLENIKYVYNIFEFSGFKPYEKYSVDFELKISNIEAITKIYLDTQDTKGTNFVDESSKKVLNNITLDDSISFSRGYSDFISVPLSFEANKDGEIFIILGLEVEEQKALDYKLSQVRLRL